MSLEGYYEVLLGDIPSGKLQIIKEGLYYKLTCRCLVPQDAVYRLYAVLENGRENLGVVIPEEDGYILRRRIPVKRLNSCKGFFLSSRSAEDTGKFVPIYPEEPFSYIASLENAFLEIRNGQLGVCLVRETGTE